MDKRDETIPGARVRPAPDAAPSRQGAARQEPGAQPVPPAFDWQALLLRYLPDPRGSDHAVKRFGAR